MSSETWLLGEQRDRLSVGDASSIILTDFVSGMGGSQKKSKNKTSGVKLVKRQKSLLKYIETAGKEDRIKNAFHAIAHAASQRDPNLSTLFSCWLQLFTSRGDKAKCQKQVLYEFAEYLFLRNGEESHEFIYETLIQVLSQHPPQNEDATVEVLNKSMKQSKLGACKLLFHIFSREYSRKNKKDRDGYLYIKMNSGERVQQMITSLWSVIRNESVVIHDQRQPTMLTISALDCLLFIFHHVASNSEKQYLVADNFDLSLLVFQEIVLWYQRHRPLYCEAINIILSQLQDSKKIIIEQRQLAAAQKIVFDDSPLYKYLSSVWNMYFTYLIEESAVFFKENNMQNYVIALLAEVDRLIVQEQESDELNVIHNQLQYTLSCVCLLFGKMEQTTLSTILKSVIKIGSNSDTTVLMALTEVVPKGLRSKSDQVQLLSSYLFRELVRHGSNIFEDSSSSLISTEGLMSLLDESDTASKAVAALIAEQVVSNPSLLSELFLRVDTLSQDKDDVTKAKARRQNALLVISEVLKIQNYDIDQPSFRDFLHNVSMHLIQRLGDDELTVRIQATELFHKLEPEFIIPQLVKRELDKSEKVRSAAHRALLSVLKHHDSCIPFLILIDAVRDCAFETKATSIVSPAQISVKESNDSMHLEIQTELANRVLLLLPDFVKTLSPYSIPKLAKVVVEKYLLSPNDTVTVHIMNKTFQALLSFSDTEQKELVVEQQRAAVREVITICKSMMVERTISTDIFNTLAPYLVLKTLPLSVINREDMATGLRELMSELKDILLERMDDSEEIDKVRQVSAEICGSLPSSLTFDKVLNELNKSNNDITRTKLFIYLMCNAVTAHIILRGKGATVDYIGDNVTKLSPVLLYMLKINTERSGEEIIKLQRGIIDCLSLLLQYLIQTQSSFNLLSVICDSIVNEPMTGLSVCMVHILTSSCRRMSLHEITLMSQQCLNALMHFLIDKCLPSAHGSVLACALLQLLLHVTYQLKAAIHPYTHVLLRVSLASLKSLSAEVRQSAVKLTTSILTSREDVFEHTVLIEDILKQMRSLATIDESSEVRRLAQQIVELLQPQ